MEFAKLKYPNLRDELIGFLRGLSDNIYQKNVWIDGNLPSGMQCDNFDMAINFLFDDMSLEEDPEGAIGIFLYDESEVVFISKLIIALNNIFDKYGTYLSDKDYIIKPEWGAVLVSAKNALLALLSNDAAQNKGHRAIAQRQGQSHSDHC